MRPTGPVAVAPRANLDAMVYGQTCAPALSRSQIPAATPSPRSAQPLLRDHAPPTHNTVLVGERWL